jgi:uncharacterized membrane protein YbhN (UPF0104 family)
VVKAVLTLGVVGGLVWVADPRALWETLRQARGAWVLAAVALLPLNLALDGWVWQVLVRPVAGRVSFRRITSAVMAGFAVGFFTPARVGEYAGRVLSLDEGDRWALGATIFAQRMLDMLIALVVGLLAFAGARWTGALGEAWNLVAWTGAGVGTVLALGTARPDAVARLLRYLVPSWTWLHERTQFLDALSGRQIAAVVSGSLVRYGVYATQTAFLVAAFLPLDHSLSPFELFLGTGLTFFIKFLIPSITLMDVGVREGAAVAAFGLFGISAATALNASLAVFVVNLVLPSLLGVPFAFRMKGVRHRSSSS